MSLYNHSQEMVEISRYYEGDPQDKFNKIVTLLKDHLTDSPERYDYDTIKANLDHIYESALETCFSFLSPELSVEQNLPDEGSRQKLIEYITNTTLSLYGKIPILDIESKSIPELIAIASSLMSQEIFTTSRTELQVSESPQAKITISSPKTVSIDLFNNLKTLPCNDYTLVYEGINENFKEEPDSEPTANESSHVSMGYRLANINNRIHLLPFIQIEFFANQKKYMESTLNQL